MRGVGRGQLTDAKHRKVEKFMCLIYNTNEEYVDNARSKMFVSAKKPDNLPPTSDALKFHIQRAHHQALVWHQACVVNMNIPDPTQLGWNLIDGVYKPILLSLPAVPDQCLELLSCNCKTGCRTMRCGCRRNKLNCTQFCKCIVNNCVNCAAD